MSLAVTFLVFYAVILGLACFISSIIKEKNIQTTLPYTPLFILFVLYCAALVGFLAEAQLVLFILGALFFALIIFCSVSGKSISAFTLSPQTLLCPVIVVPFLILLLYSIVNTDILFQDSDEIGHWGISAKEMLLTDSLRLPTTVLSHKTYGQGSNLIHYFFARVAGPQDGVFYLAQLVAMLLPLGIFFSGLCWKKHSVHILLATACLFYAVQVFTRNGFHTLYVDPLISSTLAAGVFLLAGERSVRERLLGGFLIAGCLPLYKIGSVLFALVFVFLIGALVFFYRTDKKEQRGYLLLLLLCLVALTFSTASWLVYTHSQGFTDPFAGRSPYFGNPVGQVFADIILGNEQGEYGRTVIKEFFQAFSKYPVNSITNTNRWIVQLLDIPFRDIPKCHVLAWLLIFAGMYGMAWYKMEKNKKQSKARMIAITLCASFVLYAAGLLFTYIFRYDVVEAMRAASFPRYMGIFLFPLFLLFTWLLIHQDIDKLSKKGNFSRQIKIFIFLLAFLFVYDTPGFTPYTKWYVPHLQHIKQINTHLGTTEERVCYSLDTPQEKDFNMIGYFARYDLFPRQVVISYTDENFSTNKGCLDVFYRYRAKPVHIEMKIEEKSISTTSSLQVD